MEGAPPLGELLELALLLELLREEELREEELLDEEELLEEELLDEGIELLLVGIWTDGGWLLLEVVLQPPASADSNTGRSNRAWRGFTASTCTCS
jgi:hypothetical protein